MRMCNEHVYERSDGVTGHRTLIFGRFKIAKKTSETTFLVFSTSALTLIGAVLQTKVETWTTSRSSCSSSALIHEEWYLRKVALVVLLLFVTCLGPQTALVSVRGVQRTAVILSSIDSVVPYNYYGSLTQKYLESSGYAVTLLKDQKVTLDLLASGLGKYDVIIWRTDDYTYAHRMFWYLGEHVNQQALTEYAADFAANLLDVHAGIIGVSQGFLQEHWLSGSFAHVKLAILMTSDSSVVAQYMISSGATTVIYCANPVSLQFGLLDDLNTQVVAYLSKGNTVQSAIWTTISPYLYGQQPEDPLDSTYAPPFLYLGNGGLTIT